MIVGIGILGVGGATLVLVATGTGTVIESLAMGRRVPLVEIRLKMGAALEAIVVTLVVAMATAIIATAMDRVILVLRQIRWVHLVTKASRRPLSLGPCRGPVRMV